MAVTTGTPSASHTPLRLRAGIAIAIVQLLVIAGGALVAPELAMMIGLVAGVAGTVATLVWWVGFSRARWLDRLVPIALMILTLLATRQIVHPSIAGAGMGALVFMMPLPLISAAIVAWAVATRHLRAPLRLAWLVAGFALAVIPCTLIRTAGIKNGANMELHWRWTPTPEQLLLAKPEAEPPSPPSIAVTGTSRATPAPGSEAIEPKATLAPSAPSHTVPAAAGTQTLPEWPGFRGRDRNDVVRGVRIETDWSASPPKELWRRPVGPGWSSFAVDGDFLYTQEQRGEDEIVSCYRVSSGDPVWKHRDRVRFYESNGGPGPRATPTLSRGRVHTFGATGILNALDARTGSLLWTRDATADTGKAIPDWGRTSSPLVTGDLVIVDAGVLVAYDAATGMRRWIGPERGGGYSSPHLVTVDGTPQVLMLSGFGAFSLAPADGAVLWAHEWPGGSIVQPAVTEDGDVLINSIAVTGGAGLRRLAVAHRPDGWKAEERWTSIGLKPYFNDFVVHKGHAYGFDGGILASIDLRDGTRTWKGGRYGYGQLLLLADQDLLLVLSEEGELVLVRAIPEQFTEVARFQALSGKTWNHPVVVGGVLLVRNGEEMAAFRLPAARP